MKKIIFLTYIFLIFNFTYAEEIQLKTKEDVEIEKAGHTYDLKKADFLQLKIDMEQYGLGSASCGEETLKKYEEFLKNSNRNSSISCYSSSSFRSEITIFS